MNENMENRFDLLVKWLRALMYIAIVNLVNSVVNFLPFGPAGVTTRISRGIMVGVVVCMFQLAPANERYKKAGIMRAIMLVCTLITAFVYALPSVHPSWVSGSGSSSGSSFPAPLAV